MKKQQLQTIIQEEVERWVGENFDKDPNSQARDKLYGITQQLEAHADQLQDILFQLSSTGAPTESLSNAISAHGEYLKALRKLAERL